MEKRKMFLCSDKVPGLCVFYLSFLSGKSDISTHYFFSKGPWFSKSNFNQPPV